MANKDIRRVIRQRVKTTQKRNSVGEIENIINSNVTSANDYVVNKLEWHGHSKMPRPSEVAYVAKEDGNQNMVKVSVEELKSLAAYPQREADHRTSDQQA